MEYATRIGILSLLIWSGGALFNSFACILPTFEILSIALAIGFLVGALHLSFTKTWYKINCLSPSIFIGFLGVFGNELCYVSSFKFAPAVHITLINYLWPIIVIAFSSVISKNKICKRTMLAALLGFCSVAYITINDSAGLFNTQNWIGYLLVIIGTMMWSVYILANRKGNAIPSEMIVPYCGLGAIICFLIHNQTETFIKPDLQQFLAVVWLGVMGMYVAFRCWNFGISQGNVSVLSILSYNNVLLATLLLVLFGQSEFNSKILFSVIGLMLASVLSIFELKDIKRALQLKLISVQAASKYK